MTRDLRQDMQALKRKKYYNIIIRTPRQACRRIRKTLRGHIPAERLAYSERDAEKESTAGTAETEE